MKKVISLFLACLLLLGPFAVFGNRHVTYGDFPEAYDELFEMDQYTQLVHANYQSQLSSGIWPLITNHDYYAYLRFSDQIRQDKKLNFMVWLLSTIMDSSVDSVKRAASPHKDSKLDIDASVETNIKILLNLLNIMDVDLGHADRVLREFDAIDRIFPLSSSSWKSIGKLVLDGLGIVSDAAFFELDLSLDAKKAMGVSIDSELVHLGFLEFSDGFVSEVFDKAEDYLLLEKMLQSYKAHHAFLTSIIDHTSNEKLRLAAKALRDFTHQTFSIKLQLSAELIKSETVKLSMDYALEDLAESFYDRYSMNPNLWEPSQQSIATTASDLVKFAKAFKIGAKIGVFAGDALVGASKMVERVYEINTLSDIHRALVEDMENYKGAGVHDYEKIHRAYETMKNVMYVNLRGNYCFYEMIQSDSQLLSLWHKFYGRNVDTDEWMQKTLDIHNEQVGILTGEGYYPNIFFSLKDNQDEVFASMVQGYLPFLKRLQEDPAGVALEFGLFEDPYYSYPPQEQHADNIYDVGYAFADLDLDGIPELILRTSTHNGMFCTFNVFTLRAGVMEKMISINGFYFAYSKENIYVEYLDSDLTWLTVFLAQVPISSMRERQVWYVTDYYPDIAHFQFDSSGNFVPDDPAQTYVFEDQGVKVFYAHAGVLSIRQTVDQMASEGAKQLWFTSLLAGPSIESEMKQAASSFSYHHEEGYPLDTLHENVKKFLYRDDGVPYEEYNQAQSVPAIDQPLPDKVIIKNADEMTVVGHVAYKTGQDAMNRTVEYTAIEFDEPMELTIQYEGYSPSDLTLHWIQVPDGPLSDLAEGTLVEVRGKVLLRQTAHHQTPVVFVKIYSFDILN